MNDSTGLEILYRYTGSLKLPYFTKLSYFVKDLDLQNIIIFKERPRFKFYIETIMFT